MKMFLNFEHASWYIMHDTEYKSSCRFKQRLFSLDMQHTTR